MRFIIFVPIAAVIVTLLTILYIFRYFKNAKNFAQINMRNDENIEMQILTWCMQKDNPFYFNTKDDFFSPVYMKNGDIDPDEIEIEWVDYTKDVLWFIRK